MKKIVGYIISIVGLALLALTLEPIRQALNITIPAAIANTTITIISLVLIAIGIFFVVRSPKASQKHAEVPIYHGKEIVGYRRH